MASYELLGQTEEGMSNSRVSYSKLTAPDSLHKHRLLNVEEKPFKRITKRILAPDSILSPTPQAPPTPPPEGLSDGNTEANKHDQTEDQRRQFREDVLLDFAAFENNILRIQLLLNSNARERARYATQKHQIQTTASDVRANTLTLRTQLEAAQDTLARRKGWDELAERVTGGGNRALRPRAEQQAALGALRAEIAELERESREYALTWAERRLQFGRIIDEGMQLRRLIRDEKEEVERREGMEERGDDGDEGSGEAGSSRGGRASAVATPRPDAGGATPLHAGLETSGDGRSLAVPGSPLARAKSPLRAATPGLDVQDAATPKIEFEDADMAEDGEVSADEGVESGSEGLVAEDHDGEDGRSELGEGMDRKARDRMDTS